jgi:hypothetical protein
MLQIGLELVENHYNQMLKAKRTSTRKYHADIILNLMKMVPELKEYWGYNPNEFHWQDRIFKVGEEKVSKIEVEVFVDQATNLRNAPSFEGLYFVGTTHFNPITNEQFFAVKIGLSNNINKRMSQYRTNCAMLYPIGYKQCEDYVNQELRYQGKLSRIALFANQNNDEWYFVDRQTYLDLCEKGFDYFD